MGKKVCGEASVDKDLDPEVIARRNKLFNEYVYPFRNMIYKLCIKYSFNPRNVEENYSDVLLNFYRGIETYAPSRPIRAWLHTCTKHHIWAIESKRLKREQIDDDYDVEVMEEVLLDDDEVSGNVMGLENYREHYNDDILSVLDEMKPCHRDVLLLQEAGYALKEIVEIEYKKGTLKTPNIETIKSRLRAARKYLKEHITRDGERISCETVNEDVYRDCE